MITVKDINDLCIHEARFLNWERYALENISYRLQQREKITDQEEATIKRIRERLIREAS